MCSSMLLPHQSPKRYFWLYLQKTCGLEILVSRDLGKVCFVLQQVLGCSTTWSMDAVFYYGCVGLNMWMLTFALGYVHVFSSIWFLFSSTASIFIVTKRIGGKQSLKKTLWLKGKIPKFIADSEAMSCEHVQTSVSPGFSQRQEVLLAECQAEKSDICRLFRTYNEVVFRFAKARSGWSELQSLH